MAIFAVLAVCACSGDESPPGSTSSSLPSSSSTPQSASSSSVADTDEASPPAVDWEEPQLVATGESLQLAFNATTAAARQGDTLHLAFLAGSTVRYARGTTEGYEVRDLPRSGPAGKPALAAFGDSIVVAWTARTQGGDRELDVVRSSDAGETWSEPYAVVRGRLMEPVAISGDGERLVLAYVDEADGRAFAVTWEGEAWTSDGWAAPVAIGDPDLIASDVSVAARGEEVIVSYEDATSLPAVVWLAESSDSGATFSEPHQLELDSAGPPVPGGDPSVAFTDDGTILVGFQSRGDVMVAAGTAIDEAFATVYGPEPGLFAHVNSHRGEDAAVGVIWEYFEGDLHDDARKRIGLAISSDGLDTTDGPFAQPGSEESYGRIRPSLLVSEGRVDVFWIDPIASPQQLWHQSGSLAN